LLASIPFVVYNRFAIVPTAPCQRAVPDGLPYPGDERLEEAGISMNFFNGITYNVRGLWLGIRTPKLFGLGLLRFLIMILLTLTLAGLTLAYHQEMLGLLWTKPEARWIVWLWHVVSWVLSAILLALSALLSYVLAQILFGVLIVDAMSLITERIATGEESQPYKISVVRRFGYMIRQEIPRTLLPMFASGSLMFFGLLTPLGPIVTLVSPLVAAVFLAWDNTDIVPARQFIPLKERFRFLMRNLSFHLGFGICFLIPFLNILFLSFAPVGATLYHIALRKHQLK
jgi:CysZ protein